MCKTADYDVKKDCNMYAIHTIKKILINDKLRNNVYINTF